MFFYNTIIPWFYEWEAMRYLIDIKNGDLDIFEFLKLYEIKNQFQIFKNNLPSFIQSK